MDPIKQDNYGERSEPTNVSAPSKNYHLIKNSW
jgi:hypothetical protein